jgi:hypothetical protein
MKEPKIERVKDNPTPAHYDPFENRIVYDRDLDKFPELREMILKHELDHWKNFQGVPNFFKLFWRELVDYPRLALNDDIYRYKKLKEERKIRLNTITCFNLVSFMFLVQLYTSLLNLIMLPVYFYKNRKIEGGKEL